MISLHNQVPSNICHNTKYYLRQSVNGNNLREQRCKLNAYGYRALSGNANRLWKILPNWIKIAVSQGIFGKILKTTYLKAAIYCET